MNISLNWLSDYVAHGLDADALADRLTMSGLEVEGVEATGPSLDGVVVGHVLDVRPHPNADRLRVCDVDLGEHTPEGEKSVQIVCGAPNVATGQKVPVATVGTELMLPSRDTGEPQPVNIKKGKIRGEVSRGMICAEDELGLGDDHDGILVLPEDAEVGQALADHLRQRGALPGDAVLDIAITPNRPDATSHIGVARDVAALLDVPLALPEVEIPEAGGEAAEQASVRIEDTDGCHRLVALVVRDVTVGPSPDWMRQRLDAIGIRSINNVVDVTNYVLHELGQPLHAFDLDTLAGGGLIVRAATAGETVTTLDDQERTVPEGTVLVCDHEKPVAVAGVMGGANSEVGETTTNVLIESAYFDPGRIRKASKALGLQTDASYRFERGVDPTGQARAAARAAALLAEVAGGTVVPGMVDVHPVPHEARQVTLRPSRVATVLGMEVPQNEIVRLLAAIGFQVADAEARGLDAFAEAAMREEGVAAAAAEAAGAGLVVTVPPFRPDVEREIDVIEEVARLWGFDRLPTPAATPVPLVPASDTPSARLLDRVRQRLAALGFRELYTNSLVPKATAEAFADAIWTGRDGAPVDTLNPISQEMAAMRPSLLPGLVAVAGYNQARGAGALRLFEAGRVYRQSADGSGAVDGYHEHTSLSIGMSGETPASWRGPAGETDVYDLKGVVLDVLASLGLDDIEETPRPAPEGVTAYALDLATGGARLGSLGLLAESIGDSADLSAPLFVAELDWDAIASRAESAPPTYQTISRFPVAERDLAVVVPTSQPAGPLLRTIRKAGGPLLQDVRLFDLYTGDNVGDDEKSLAFGLTFGADRTLRDKEIDGRVRRIVKALDAQHGAVLRG